MSRKSQAASVRRVIETRTFHSTLRHCGNVVPSREECEESSAGIHGEVRAVVPKQRNDEESVKQRSSVHHLLPVRR